MESIKATRRKCPYKVRLASAAQRNRHRIVRLVIGHSKLQEESSYLIPPWLASCDLTWPSFEWPIVNLMILCGRILPLQFLLRALSDQSPALRSRASNSVSVSVPVPVPVPVSAPASESSKATSPVSAPVPVPVPAPAPAIPVTGRSCRRTRPFWTLFSVAPAHGHSA